MFILISLTFSYFHESSMTFPRSNAYCIIDRFLNVFDDLLFCIMMIMVIDQVNYPKILWNIMSLWINCNTCLDFNRISLIEFWRLSFSFAFWIIWVSRDSSISFNVTLILRIDLSYFCVTKILSQSDSISWILACK